MCLRVCVCVCLHIHTHIQACISLSTEARLGCLPFEQVRGLGACLQHISKAMRAQVNWGQTEDPGPFLYVGL